MKHSNHTKSICCSILMTSKITLKRKICACAFQVNLSNFSCAAAIYPNLYTHIDNSQGLNYGQPMRCSNILSTFLLGNGRRGNFEHASIERQHNSVLQKKMQQYIEIDDRVHLFIFLVERMSTNNNYILNIRQK